MNVKTKKNIAKEIIYFFSVILLLFLVWCGINIKNIYLDNKINHYTKTISILKLQIDSFKSKPWNNKYEYLLNGKKYSQEDLIKYANLNKISLNDYIKKKQFDIVLIRDSYDEYGIPIKFTPPIDGTVVSEKNIKQPNLTLEKENITNDLRKLEILYKSEKIAIKNLFKYKSSYLTDGKIKYYMFYCFILLFGFLYPVRLIYKLLKWSFLTLKKKD